MEIINSDKMAHRRMKMHRSRESGQLTTNMKDNLVILELFGSKIRGDFEKDSDIDMFVVLKKEIC